MSSLTSVSGGSFVRAFPDIDREHDNFERAKPAVTVSP